MLEIPPDPERSSSPPSSQGTRERREARQKRVATILKWTGLPGGGLGISFAVYLLRNGRWLEAGILGLVSIIALFLAIGGKFVTDLSDRIIDKVEERLEQRTDTLAQWIVDSLESRIIQVWWRLTSQFQGDYYKNLVYLYRAYETQGLKTPGDFTPDLEKVFVPLRFLPQSPDKISSGILPVTTTQASSDLKIWDFLAESPNQPAYKRIAILGAPGSGKTTLLKYTALTYAQNKQRRQHRKAPTLIPVLLVLYEVRHEILREESPSLAQVIIHQLSNPALPMKLNPQLQWFEDKLKQGECLVMFDGLDEVAKEQERLQVSQWIDLQMQRYPESIFIVTSRRHGYNQGSLKQVRTFLEVQSFNLKQVERFFDNWYLQNEILRQVRKADPGVRAKAKEKAKDLMDRIKRSAPLAEMALNPLLLTMITTVHDNRGALPKNRVELYAEICEVLLTRRIEAKGIAELMELNLIQKKAVLQVLALELMKRGWREFSLNEGKSMIDRALAAVAKKEVKAEDFFEHIEKVVGLLSKSDENSYRFAHLSFQEYLASAQVQESQQELLLINNIDDPWWAETIRLYAAKNDVTDLVGSALENPSVTSFALALDCLEEGKSCSPEVRKRFNELWKKGWAKR